MKNQITWVHNPLYNPGALLERSNISIVGPTRCCTIAASETTYEKDLTTFINEHVLGEIQMTYLDENNNRIIKIWDPIPDQVRIEAESVAFFPINECNCVKSLNPIEIPEQIYIARSILRTPTLVM